MKSHSQRCHVLKEVTACLTHDSLPPIPDPYLKFYSLLRMGGLSLSNFHSQRANSVWQYMILGAKELSACFLGEIMPE